MYLRFSRGEALWVDVLGLEPREVQLARRHVEGIGRQKHCRHLQALEDGQGLLRGVVRRVVEEDHGVLAPAFARPIKLKGQLLHEDAHGVGVVIRLSQRVKDGALRVDGQGQGDPWVQRLLGQGAALPFLVPHRPAEVGLPDPRLVDVEEDLVVKVRLQEAPGPRLSQQDVPHGVDVHGLVLRLGVGHVQVLLEKVPYELEPDLLLVVLQDLALDSLSRDEDLAFLRELERRLMHQLLFENVALLVLDERGHLVLILLHR